MALLISSTLGFLSLLVLSQAADPKCEDLIKPLVLQDDNFIIGKWILIEAISSSPKLANVLKTVNSSWAEFTPGSSGDTVTLRQGSMRHGDCQEYSMNITFKNSTFYSTLSNETMEINILPSCPDCLTMSHASLEKNKDLKYLYFFSKRPKVSESERDRLWEQAACLGFEKEPQFSYDGVSDLCQMEKSDSVEGQKEPEPNKSD